MSDRCVECSEMLTSGGEREKHRAWTQDTMYTLYIMYTYIHTIICEGAADYT